MWYVRSVHSSVLPVLPLLHNLMFNTDKQIHDIFRYRDRYECNSSTSFKQGLRRVVNAALAITEVQLHAQQQLARELEVGSAVTEVQTAASTS